MDIPHIKLLTQNIRTCIATHSFDKKHDRSKPLGYKPVKPHHTRRIFLLLTLVLGSASDSCDDKDILLVVGFNYNLMSIKYTNPLVCCQGPSYYYSLVVEGKKHPNPEKNGRKLNLVSIDAEFPIDRHIQNSLKSSIGKKFYDIF